MRGPTEGTISEAVFDEVCPSTEVVHVNLQVDNNRDQWKNAMEVLAQNYRCLVIDDKVFNWKCAYSSSSYLPSNCIDTDLL